MDQTTGKSEVWEPVDPFSQPITISLGGGVEETNWTPHRLPDWSHFARWLTTHEEGPKEGPSFTAARLKAQWRNSDAAEENDVLMLDYDSGYTLAEIEAAVRAKGWAAAISSSHSHLTRTTDLGEKGWLKFKEKHPAATPAEYLIKEKGLLPHIAEGATVETYARQIRRGGRRKLEDRALFHHQPCPKFRVALLLATPWRRADFSAEHDPAETWKAAVGWVAAELGLQHDESAVDPARLFFLPRHRKGATPETAIIEGAACAVDWSAVAAPAYAPEDGLPPDDLDRLEDIKRVIELLKQKGTTEPAVEGAMGDETTFNVARAVRDNGISEDTCLGLMATHYNQHCAPPWPVTGRESLEAKVRSAYKGKPIGTDTPRYHFRHFTNDNCETTEKPKKSRLRIVDPTKLQGVPVPPQEWVVDNWMPMAQTTALYGDGAVGKSTLAQQLATAISLGVPCLGLKTKKLRVLGVFCEDDEGVLHRRQFDINAEYGIDFTQLTDFRWMSRTGAEDNLLMTFNDKRGEGVGKLTKFWHDIEAAVKDYGAQVVIIDTAADTFGGNENIRPQVRSFIQGALTRLAISIGGAVLLCAHPSLSGMASGEGTGGSTAWNNTVRSRWYLTKPDREKEETPGPDDGSRVLTKKKYNYAPPGADDLGIERHGNVFRLSRSSAAEMFDEAQRHAFEKQGEAAFLDCLRAMTKEGRGVSHSPNAKNYAPKVFAGRKEAAGFSKKDLAAAMERLFRAGRIEANAIIGKGAHRHPIRGIGECAEVR
jgi:RecA-family ATPase